MGQSGPTRTGTAAVSTVVAEDVLVPGEPFSGTVVVRGGDTGHHVDGLEHRLVASTPAADGTSAVTLNSWQVADLITVEAGRRRTLDFEYVLHEAAPATAVDGADCRADLWLETAPAGDAAVAGGDAYLNVAPLESVRTAIAAMDRLGLVLDRVTADATRRVVCGRRTHTAYDQVFEFRATERYDGPPLDGCRLHVAPRVDEGTTDILVECEPRRGPVVRKSVRIDHDRTDIVNILGALSLRLRSIG